MSRWSRSLPVLAVVGAISVAGCGGSDYPSKPNGICKKSAEQAKGLTRPKAVADLHVYFLKYQSIVTDAARQFKAVKPPSDKQAAYQSFLAALDREVVVFRQATNTVANNPKGALTLLQRQSSLSQEVNARAKAAGLTQCTKTG